MELHFTYPDYGIIYLYHKQVNKTSSILGSVKQDNESFTEIKFYQENN